MSYRLKALLPGLALSALCACGGAGNPFDDAVTTPFGPISSDEAAIHQAAYDAQRSDIMGLTITPSSEVPTDGDATFNGRSQITVAPANTEDTMLFTGEAVMKVEFETPSVGVRMTNFTGSDMLGQTVRLEGTLAVENGIIDQVERNTFGGSFGGVLLSNGTDIRVTTGAFEGSFRDIPTSAASFEGQDKTASYNAEPAVISLSGIVAE